MTLFIVLCIVAVFLAAGLFREQASARKLSELSWRDLVKRLEQVEGDGIETIAVSHLSPDVTQTEINAEELYNMVGRATGLSRMRANSDVFIALATYAENWNPYEGAAVAERMRRD